MKKSFRDMCADVSCILTLALVVVMLATACLRLRAELPQNKAAYTPAASYYCPDCGNVMDMYVKGEG